LKALEDEDLKGWWDSLAGNASSTTMNGIIAPPES